MKKILKVLLGYWLEISIGGLILLFVEDIRWFLFYLLIILLLRLALLIDYLRMLVRVLNVSTEVKLMAVIKKLNISNEELREAGDEVDDELTDEQRKSIYKDMDDLGLK